MPLTLTSELDAVNVCLRNASFSPVSTLDSGQGDVRKAYDTLIEISRDIQKRGWHFNTDKNYRLLPTQSGEIFLPNNTLRVDVVGTPELTQRGSRLYNRYTHTFVLNKTIEADIVLFLKFEELPEAARRYITIRAARTFQERHRGSETSSSFTRADEIEAKLDLKKAEGVTANRNILNGNRVVNRIVTRRMR